MPEFVFESWLTRAIVALVFLIVGWWGARKIEGAAERALTRMKIDMMLVRFTANIVRWGIITLVVIAALGAIGIKTTSFAAVLGAAGIAIGLACQGVLGSLAAGILLLVLRPFKVGDFIRAGGETGTVIEVGLFTTLLNTPDNRRLIIQNKNVFGGNIENITHHPRRRADIAVGVSYDADIDQTRAVLEEAARNTPGGLAEPAPMVWLDGFGDSAVNWSVRVWANSADFGATKQALVRSIKYALDAAGLGIPYPQMDVHLPKSDAAPVGEAPPKVIASPTDV